MQKRYYLDTCIWRDYFENREDRLRPIGEWAFALIRQIIENEDIVVYSDVVEDELLMDYSPKEVLGIIGIVPSSLLLKVVITKNQVKEGHSLSKEFQIPLKDAFHAVLARDNGAVMVSRDRHFFALFKVVPVQTPEELI